MTNGEQIREVKKQPKYTYPVIHGMLNNLYADVRNDKI